MKNSMYNIKIVITSYCILILSIMDNNRNIKKEFKNKSEEEIRYEIDISSYPYYIKPPFYELDAPK